MDVPQLILIALVVALAVAAITWFGPRSSQWRSDGQPADTAPLSAPPDERQDAEADESADEDPDSDDDVAREPPPEGPEA